MHVALLRDIYASNAKLQWLVCLRKVFNVGCRQLILAGDYARLNILVTILTTVLLEATEVADCTGLSELLINVHKLIAHKKALLLILNS